MGTQEFIERYVIAHGFLSDAELEKERIAKLVRMHRELKRACQASELSEAGMAGKRVCDLNISSRISNALFFAGYKTVGDLIGLSKSDIEAVPDLGKIGCLQLLNALTASGIVIKNNRLAIM